MRAEHDPHSARGLYPNGYGGSIGDDRGNAAAHPRAQVTPSDRPPRSADDLHQ
jgi:hypothetical protein